MIKSGGLPNKESIVNIVKEPIVPIVYKKWSLSPRVLCEHAAISDSLNIEFGLVGKMEH